MAKHRRLRYTFDEPLRLKNKSVADANAIGGALEQIRETNDGRLTPENTVKAAADKRNPLHPHFEWDDTIAAHQWRIETARTIIRSVRIVDDDYGQPVRAFLSVNDDGVSYRSLGEIKRSADLQESVLAQCKRDLEAFERRYSELHDICKLVHSARRKAEKRIEKLRENRAAA